ncbi:hypothetical protein HDU76_006256 [Blyttiomyces sp. JEL0837]|nr:hypothetical protein HDU76_006256 [Blyttiomyces sp. JEL0837]
MGKTGKERKKRKLMAAIASGGKPTGADNMDNGSIEDETLIDQVVDNSVDHNNDDDDDHLPHKPHNEAIAKNNPLDKLIPELLAHGVKITQRDLGTTVAVLNALNSSAETLRMPMFKPLRTVLHSLQKSAAGAGINTGQSLPGKVSDAIFDRRWTDAIVYLSEMRAKKIVPKLGALQRWVRDCDAAAVTVPSTAASGKKTQTTTTVGYSGKRDAVVMRVLDAILRTSDPKIVGFCSIGESNLSKFPVSDGVRILPSWDAMAGRVKGTGVEQMGTQITAPESSIQQYKPLFYIISQEQGSDRRPPNLHPMTLYTSLPKTIDLTTYKPSQTTKHPTQHIPGSFLLKNLLSLEECRQILLAAESIGFSPDEPSPVGSSSSSGDSSGMITDAPTTSATSNSILAHNVFWLADQDFMNELERRALPHLPATLEDDVDIDDETTATNVTKKPITRTISGINPRFRVYRYVPGAVYRPHIDGAWPRSHYDPETKEYTFDASNNTTWSRLTFLIYLNEGFEGGQTTYFVPGRDVGVVESRSVVPRAGCCMVFPHGSCRGNLLHEGSGVLKGAKYVIRTEVLYKKPSVGAGGSNAVVGK